MKFNNADLRATDGNELKQTVFVATMHGVSKRYLMSDLDIHTVHRVCVDVRLTYIRC